MPTRPLRAAVSALLGLVFLAGLAGEAYGVHDCPHHHGDDRGRAAAHASQPSAGAAHAAARASDAPLRAPPDGPCTCVGSCHAAATALDAASPPSIPAALETDLAGALPAVDDRTRRPAAYLLPFANAPPPTIA